MPVFDDGCFLTRRNRKNIIVPNNFFCPDPLGTCKSKLQLSLFSKKCFMFCDNSIALTNSFVDVGLGQVDLVLVLLLVLGELGALEVGLREEI